MASSPSGSRLPAGSRSGGAEGGPQVAFRSVPRSGGQTGLRRPGSGQNQGGGGSEPGARTRAVRTRAASQPRRRQNQGGRTKAAVRTRRPEPRRPEPGWPEPGWRPEPRPELQPGPERAGSGPRRVRSRWRRGRFRERGRNRQRPGGQGGGANFGEADPIIRDDDVLVPIAGILDILDNYGFVRTTGYLPGRTTSTSRWPRCAGTACARATPSPAPVRQPRDGERREKFNALVRLDTVNGMDPEQARKPGRVQQADAALPAGAAAPRDRARS